MDIYTYIYTHVYIYVHICYIKCIKIEFGRMQLPFPSSALPGSPICPHIPNFLYFKKYINCNFYVLSLFGIF